MWDLPDFYGHSFQYWLNLFALIDLTFLLALLAIALWRIPHGRRKAR